MAVKDIVVVDNLERVDADVDVMSNGADRCADRTRGQCVWHHRLGLEHCSDFLLTGNERN